MDKKKLKQIANKILDLDPIILDTETTGLSNTDQIVEISLIDTSGNEIFTSLIRPTIPISTEASRITGITEDMIAKAPLFVDVFSSIKETLLTRVLVIYNAKFDVRMINQSLSFIFTPKRAICLMEMYAQWYNEIRPPYKLPKWQSLVNAAKQCEIVLPENIVPHRAYADCWISLQILKYMANWEVD